MTHEEIIGIVKSKLEADSVLQPGFEFDIIAQDFAARIGLDLSLNSLINDTAVDEQPDFDPSWL
jgi:hypothetical protein